MAAVFRRALGRRLVCAVKVLFYFIHDKIATRLGKIIKVDPEFVIRDLPEHPPLRLKEKILKNLTAKWKTFSLFRTRSH